MEVLHDVPTQQSLQHTVVQAVRITLPDNARDAPAPGAYNVPQDTGHGPAWSMPRSKRADVDTDADAPAPGDYESKAPACGPAYTMPATTHTPVSAKATVYVPGPGEYDATVPLSSAPAYTMAPKSPSALTANDDLLHQPGPAEYMPTSPSPGPAYTIAARRQLPQQRDDAAAETGPGAYSPAPAFPAGPAFSVPCAPRSPDAQEETLPGELHSLPNRCIQECGSVSTCFLLESFV